MFSDEEQLQWKSVDQTLPKLSLEPLHTLDEKNIISDYVILDNTSKIHNNSITNPQLMVVFEDHCSSI